MPKEFSDTSAKAFGQHAETATPLRHELYYKAVFLNPCPFSDGFENGTAVEVQCHSW